MADLDRLVAGLTCREVLADLSAYLDGDLPDARVAALGAHVAECTHCAAFGERFAKAVGQLRAMPAPALAPALMERVRATVAATRTPPLR